MFWVYFFAKSTVINTKNACAKPLSILGQERRVCMCNEKECFVESNTYAKVDTISFPCKKCMYRTVSDVAYGSAHVLCNV